MATLTQQIKAAYAELMPALFLAPGAEAMHKFLSSAIADGDTEMHQLLSEKNESTDDALSKDMDKMKIMQRLNNGQKTTSNKEKTTDVTDKQEPLILFHNYPEPIGPGQSYSRLRMLRPRRRNLKY